MSSWADHAQRLQRALDRSPGAENDWTLEQIETGISRGDLQFWPGPNSSAVTQCYTDENGNTTVHVLFGAGRMPEMLTGLHHIENFARDIGAGRVTLSGRVGWRRVLLPYGYSLCNSGDLFKEIA